MNAIFFNTPEVQGLMRNCQDNLKLAIPQNSFCKNKLKLINDFLDSAISNPTYWDDNTQSNIESSGLNFKNTLAAVNHSEQFTSQLFCICFRFVLERDILNPDDSNHLASAYKKFALYNENKFDTMENHQITYAMREMPLAIVKKIVFSENVKNYKDFSESFRKAETMKSNWEIYLNNKEKKIDELNKILARQESAFNFVGLYAGFAKLGRIKANEFRWARDAMLGLGFLIPIPLVIESIYIASTDIPLNSLSHLIKVIPVVSITLILIYFFRVALSNYNSVRAQVMQIELRKSLCRFIQNYSEYAKDMKAENKELLSKFEDVVFSNIMTSEDKTPSTFDGIEQLAGLINAVKGGKG